MASNIGSSMKSHVVCLPFPIQSHIGAMLKLAKLLHHRGLHITFVNTEYNHRRMLEASGSSFLDDLPADFQFTTVPDGLPASQENATQDIVALCGSVMLRMEAPFSALVGDLNKKAAAECSGSGSSPPVSCIVSDIVMSFAAHPTSAKFGVPVVNLSTVPACAMMVFLHYPMLKEKGLFPLKDESPLADEYLDRAIDWIPGMKNMRVRDLPLDFSRIMDPDGLLRNFSMECVARLDKASASIIHTFEPLERDVSNALSSKLSTPTYPIGPFQLLLDRIPDGENRLKHIGANLWKEDTECLRWLDSQNPESVLYINFGSVAFLTSDQLVEFSMGIANSNVPFLWIIRPDLVKGETTVLPPQFDELTNGRAFISEWCPQQEVLNHPSVGGFLTHCGWNSTLESLCAGVPMLCWPYGGDQLTICRYICANWEAGLEIGGDVKREKVKRLVKQLMEDEEGKHMKTRAVEWKRLAVEATSLRGSSSTNFDKLVQRIVSK